MKDRWWAFAIFGCLCWSPEAWPGELAEDILFIKALRTRGLYELAEKQCCESLQAENLPSEGRAALTVEWIDTLGEHALACEGEKRAELWKQAQEIAAEFSKTAQAGPWSLPVRLAAAKVLTAQAKVLRLQAELARLAGSVEHTGADIESPRSILKQAVREMKDVEAAVAELLKSPARPGGHTEDRLSEQELLSLEKQVRFWTALAYQELAQTYPEGSEDFVAALNECVERLRVLSQLPAEHPLALASRLRFVEALVLLRDQVASRRILEELQAWDLDPRQRMVFIAAWLRWAVAFRDTATLSKWFEMAAGLEEPRPPEVDYAMLEAAVFFYSSGRQSDSAKRDWENRIKELVESVRRSGSSYWTRRAELLVAQTVALEAGRQDLNMQVYIAENAYRAGRWEEALRAYRQAAQMAESSGQVDQAIRLTRIAAAVAAKQGNYLEAWQLLDRIVQQFPQHSQAAGVAYSALVNLGQLVLQNPEEFLNLYEQRLKEFLARFGGSEYAFRVDILLGQLLEYRSKPAEALESYLSALEKVPVTLIGQTPEEVATDSETQSPQAAETRGEANSAQRVDVGLDRLFAGLDRCCKKVFEAADEGLTGKAQIIGGRLHRWVTTLPPEIHASFWALQAEEHAARIYLWWAHDSAMADRIVSRYLAEPADLQKIVAGKERAAGLLVSWATLKLEVLAHLGQERQADMWIECLRSATFDQRWRWAEELLPRFAHLEPAVVRRLAFWVVKALPDFPQVYAGQSAEWQQKAGRDYAQLLVLAGDSEAAIAWLRRLSKEFPDVGEFQENLALLLAQQSDRALRAEALDKFREITRRAPQGSPRWFRAKYMVAWLLVQDGQGRQALETITLLESLYPELGGSPLRERFLALKRQCELQIAGQR